MPKAIERGTARYDRAGRRHPGEADGVVGSGKNRLGKVASDLGGIDVEGCHDLYVSDRVTAEHDMHETGDDLGRCRVGVEAQSLHKGRRAIADPNERQTKLMWRRLLVHAIAVRRAPYETFAARH